MNASFTCDDFYTSGFRGERYYQKRADYKLGLNEKLKDELDEAKHQNSILYEQYVAFLRDNELENQLLDEEREILNGIKVEFKKKQDQCQSQIIDKKKTKTVKKEVTAYKSQLQKEIKKMKRKVDKFEENLFHIQNCGEKSIQDLLNRSKIIDTKIEALEQESQSLQLSLENRENEIFIKNTHIATLSSEQDPTLLSLKGEKTEKVQVIERLHQEIEDLHRDVLAMESKVEILGTTNEQGKCSLEYFSEEERRLSGKLRVICDENQMVAQEIGKVNAQIGGVQKKKAGIQKKKMKEHLSRPRSSLSLSRAD